MKLRPAVVLTTVASLYAEALPLGQVIDRVPCAAGSSQTYSLYPPSNYSPAREWPVTFGFDPRARGAIPVERYRAAAEKYGYIVAGSNNSSNGSWAASMAAARAMATDVPERFRVDMRRVYAAGMSGGARVSMGLAL